MANTQTETHTPAPWVYGSRKDGSKWLSLGDPSTGPHYQGDLHTSDADARLIVAAPEMLELLKSLHTELVRQKINFGPIIADAEALIAKAEGRS